MIAYARLLPPGLRFSEVNLGRFVVKADFRKQGLAINCYKKRFKKFLVVGLRHPIRISAQDYLQVFYEQYGFIRISDVYLEDDIPHVEMVKESE